MTNSIERVKEIIEGDDGGQNVCDMYNRINQNRDVIVQALKTRQFFSSGWFRLWRKNVLNEKTNKRDGIAFAELQWLKMTVT